MAAMTHTADVVIVGAGIMGVSTAYHLARLAVRVVGVMTRQEWLRMPRKHRSTRPRRLGGQYTERAALHLDADGSTVLIPIEVRA